MGYLYGNGSFACAKLRTTSTHYKRVGETDQMRKARINGIAAACNAAIQEEQKSPLERAGDALNSLFRR
jgi:hypothetical protein